VPPNFLKWLRVVVALAVLAAFTAALVDFRGLVPSSLGHRLAEIQFVPSLVALLTGAGVSLACVVIAVVTLAFGRIYCSVICPLGIFQDVVSRVASWLKRKSRPLPFARPLTWLRQTFFWATVLAAITGCGAFALSLLDPYSNFGRIASDFFRPLAALANNALVGPADKLGWHGLYRVIPAWFGLEALVVPALVLLVVAGLAAWRGRLYCNTVCPVGTLLGWLSQRAAFRLQIDQGACRKCAKCLRACKAQCIDLRAGAIDFSRCVACYDCMGVCDQHGIGYRFVWAARSSALKPAGLSRSPLPPEGGIPNSDFSARPASIHNPQRRAFLTQAIMGIAGAAGVSRVLAATDKQGVGDAKPGHHSRAICPPGSASVERFLDRCTACHLCISQCPTGTLQPAFLEYGLDGLMKPHLVYAAAFCNFDCRRCGEVCPDGAIDLLDVAAKKLIKIGEAQFDRNKCIVATNGTDCAACSEHCPTKAVTTVPYGENLRLPLMRDDLCIGCGACEYACPAKPDKAIKVAGWSRHSIAKIFIEPKATLPKSNGDFPF
jgi:ferredoxin